MLTKEERLIKRAQKAVATRKKNREAKINATYHNREWLFSRYIIDRMTLESIATICGVEYDVIWDALALCNIKNRLLETKYDFENWVNKMKKCKIPYIEI